MTASTSMQSSGQSKPRTLGDLRRIPDFDPRGASISVRNEIRRNLLRAIEKGETLFPSVHGYEDTVIPQIINALRDDGVFVAVDAGKQRFAASTATKTPSSRKSSTLCSPATI